MAAPSTLSTKIEQYLSNAEAEVDFLPELAEGWAEESEGNRASWQIEWGDAMFVLRWVNDASRAGQLNEDQHDRYRALLRRILAYLPIIRHLGLAEPPVPLDEAA